jgi:Lipase (class 3)
MPQIAYSASSVDLFFPCRRGEFFPSGLPDSEAAICAEMCRLAYCRTSMSDFALDQDKLQSILAGIGFSVPQCFETKGLSENRGTHCFLTRHPGRELAVIAIRGTDKDDPSNVSDDVEFRLGKWEPGGRVHTGFATALSQIRNELDSARRGIDCKLLITGHSLGAASATLLASAWISASSTGTNPPIALYTFGSPRVGDAAFVGTLSLVANARYVDCCDEVTRIPPRLVGYQHVGDPQYIDRNGRITSNPGSAFMDTDRLSAAAEYALKYFGRGDNVAARELADHAPINYVSAVMGVRA